jgi:tRNA (guanine37-N1)-methyltransferase
VYEDQQVPPVLLSGHHENIRKWRLYQSLKRTWENRPELLANRIFTKEEEKMMLQIRAEAADNKEGK